MTEVELVYDADCPNVAAARLQLRRAFERVGAKPRWREWCRGEEAIPARARGHGSPTILVRGRDVAGGGGDGGPCCRLYPRPDGTVAGVPDVTTIAAALRDAARGGRLEPAPPAALQSPAMAEASASREFDLVAYGATGFTGRQVAAYLARSAPAGLRWAVAGRSPERVQRVAREVGAPGWIVADSGDPDSIDAMVARARVVASTAGPFIEYGTPVVDACARHGADYVDITGETPWVRDLIDRHHDGAAARGVKIVPCCGFDSVPSDLGALFVVDHIREVLGEPTRRVSASFTARGGLNGGTLATMLTLAERGRIRGLTDELLLNPAGHLGEDERRESRDLRGVVWDEDREVWLAPFVMAPINTRVVRRSAALAADYGAPYGPAFRYHEAVEARRRTGAAAWALATGGMDALVVRRAGRALLRRVGPSPGQGPSEERMDRGFFRLRLVGEAEGGRRVLATVGSRGDPGNRVTVMMVSESALALATERERLPGGPERGGILTPATALGEPLLNRLRRAGLTVRVDQASG